MASLKTGLAVGVVVAGALVVVNWRAENARLESENEGMRQQTEEVARREIASAPVGAASSGGDPEVKPDMRTPRQRAVDELNANPEYQRLSQLVRKGDLDKRFVSVFRQLKLEPHTLDRLKDLLVERERVTHGIPALLKEKGMDTRTLGWAGMERLLAAVRADVDAQIGALIGERGLARVAEFESTAPFRYPLEGLAKRLAYGPEPLTDELVDQLTRDVARAVSYDEAFVIGPYVLPEETLMAAKHYLSPMQWDALNRLRTEQTAQNDMWAAHAEGVRQGLIKPEKVAE